MADRSPTDGEHRPPYRTDQPSGADLIAEERKRQVRQEGWTPEHDDEHDAAELTMAAYAYLYWAVGQVNGICWPEDRDRVPNSWPWGDESWKPSDDPIRNLVKAGALLAAEIDRLQRVTCIARSAGAS